MTELRRTALITGSGRNIGRATAIALAARGHNVVVNGSRNKDACDAVAAEAAKLGVKTLVAMGDVGDAQTCADIAGAALDEFGTVDILVNNAAIRPESPFLDMSEEEWNRCAGGGHVGGLLAVAGLPAGHDRQELGTYCQCGRHERHSRLQRPRACLRRQACGLGPDQGAGEGVRRSAAYPPTSCRRGQSPATTPTTPKWRRISRHLRNPGFRWAAWDLPEEVAAAISLLASDEGAFINGQMIQVNGGTQT